MAPSSFPLFSLLPTELRLSIWAYAPTPRVVELEFREETTEWHAEGSMIPLLHTCREARSEVFKIYKPIFGALIHWQTDILYVRMKPDARKYSYNHVYDWHDVSSAHWVILFMENPEIREVRKLALESGRWLMLEASKRVWPVVDGELVRVCTYDIVLQHLDRLGEVWVVLGDSGVGEWQEGDGWDEGREGEEGEEGVGNRSEGSGSDFDSCEDEDGKESEKSERYFTRKEARELGREIVLKEGEMREGLIGPMCSEHDLEGLFGEMRGDVKLGKRDNAMIRFCQVVRGWEQLGESGGVVES